MVFKILKLAIFLVTFIKAFTFWGIYSSTIVNKYEDIKEFSRVKF